MSTVQLIIIAIYITGFFGWIIIWFYSGGFELSKSNKILWVPFILILAVLCIEIASTSVSIESATFRIEEELLQVIEGNTRHLIMAIFGILVLAATASSHKRQFITRRFFLYQMLSMMFIVGGVLPLYWFPLDHPKLYQILRHFKTVFYLYSIGYFIAGLIILIKNLMDYIGEEEKI